MSEKARYKATFRLQGWLPALFAVYDAIALVAGVIVSFIVLDVSGANALLFGVCSAGGHNDSARRRPRRSNTDGYEAGAS